ncbi:MAG: transposase [Actinobacteria bacterium]|nr:transposase [Actinomycetota bacterium]
MRAWTRSRATYERYPHDSARRPSSPATSATQELTVLSLHLLQGALVYVNTLMIQDVLARTRVAERLTVENQRGVNPLFTSNMTPYGEVKLDMTSRLDLSDPTPPPPEAEASAA